MSKYYSEEQIHKAFIAGMNLCQHPKGTEPFYNEFIASLTPIELPTEEEKDKRFMNFLQKELELGISDKVTIERIEWYYSTYFSTNKIKGGGE